MYEQLNSRRKAGAELGIKIIAGFEMMTKNPMAVQNKVLLELLEENKDTEYGKKYGIGDIKSIEEYQAKVPVTEYDDYSEYIDRMANDGERSLIYVNDPVWYNKTSGTVGVPKKIPYFQKTRDWFNRYSLIFQQGFVYRNLGDKFLGGRALNLIRCGGKIILLPDSVPYGPISEASLRPFLDRWDSIFSMPAEAVFAGKGVDTRYLNARYALCDKDVNNIVCTFTGFLLDFCRYIEKNWELLVNDIEKGTIDESVELPDDVREKISAEIKPMPERAAELRAIFEKGFDTPFMPQVWPELNYVVGGA